VGAFVKNSIKNAVRLGAYYGLFMGIFFCIMYSIIDGITIGLIWGFISMIICGVLFGGFMFLFIHYQSKKFIPIREEISKNVKIVLDDGANHYMGKEAVGGWLFLTEKMLKFISHKFNIQNHTLDIPVNEICALTVTKSLKIFRNGLIIEMQNGTKERFVVNDPDKWIEQINFVKNRYTHN